VSTAVSALAPVAAVRRIVALADRHAGYRVDGGISLVASQNRISPQALALLGSSFAAKFTSGERGVRAHAGGRWLDEMEAVVADLAGALFAPWHAELRPPAGSIANESLLMAFARPGDAIIAPDPLAGGHASLRPEGFAGINGLAVHDLPFADGGVTIDLDALDRLAAKVRPRLILIGTAKITRGYPVGRIAGIAERHGANLVFDAAHVAGLIAGGAFPDPLGDGALAYTGSTQKTFPGPVGGLIVSRDMATHERIRAVTRLRLDNYQNNRIAAMGVVLAEMLSFGGELTRAVVATARRLGAALAAHGLEPEGRAFGYTETHMVLVDTTPIGGGPELCRALEAVGLFTTATQLWPTTPGGAPRPALRLGANDIARLGYGEEAVTRLAGLITDVAFRRRPADRIAADVAALASEHRQIAAPFSLPL